MKRYLKICSVAFLAGVGAGRVLIWLNMGLCTCWSCEAAGKWLRDRLLQSIGLYTGKAENGNTEVKTDDVICRLRWVLNGEEPRQGA